MAITFVRVRIFLRWSSLYCGIRARLARKRRPDQRPGAKSRNEGQ
jgi:hypothetical protein